jgi:acetyl esterase/lipase
MKTGSYCYHVAFLAVILNVFGGGIVVTLHGGEMVKLWPDTPPGYQTPAGEEGNKSKPSDRGVEGKPVIRIGNVSQPALEVFLPPEGNRSGAAMVICPGGGFNILAWDLEGTEVAEWFNTQGIAAFVLKYRVPTNAHSVKWEPPAQDAQRAIRWVRSQAEKYGIDKEKVGILGFSAGGCTAARATLHQNPTLYDAVDAIDQESAKPNLAVLIYPAYLVGQDGKLLDDVKIDASTPPMFLAYAFDDPVRPENAIEMMAALKRANVPSELHLYDTGGHGYGLRQGSNPAAAWADRCREWLQRKNWSKPSK